MTSLSLFRHEQRHVSLQSGANGPPVAPFAQPLGQLPAHHAGWVRHDRGLWANCAISSTIQATRHPMKGESAGISIADAQLHRNSRLRDAAFIDSIEELFTEETPPPCPWLQLQPAFIGDGGQHTGHLANPRAPRPARGDSSSTLVSQPAGVAFDPAVITIPEGETQASQVVHVSATGLGGRRLRHHHRPPGGGAPPIRIGRTTALLAIERAGRPALQSLAFPPRCGRGWSLHDGACSPWIKRLTRPSTFP